LLTIFAFGAQIMVLYIGSFAHSGNHAQVRAART